MNINSFKENIKQLSSINNINFTDEQMCKLYKYMNLLIEWNKNVNLTAITEENEVILKHFIDSAIVNKYLGNYKTLIDVGTGAGFPGLVLKIVNEELDITLLDALNKRISFLNEVIVENNLNNIIALHGRAEDFGKDINYREKYDVVVSRAVANMNVLLEYMMPLVKVGGICVCMKSVNAEDELEKAKNVVNILGGDLEKLDKIYLKDNDSNIIERDIIIIRKIFSTDYKYPRNSNRINKKPLL